MRPAGAVFDCAVHIIVVGCGRVGSELAVSLVRLDHDVVIMDKNPAAFRRLAPDWGGSQVVGFGFDRDDLESAGIHSAGALAAVTSGDNSNILTARIARETYEVPHVMARIYDPRRAQIYQRLGIPTVATVTWTVEQALRRLFPETSVTEWTDPSGKLVLVERALPDGWSGRRLDRLGAAGRCRLVAVTRSGLPVIAGEDLIGQEGDLLHLAVLTEALDQLESALREGPDE